MMTVVNMVGQCGPILAAIAGILLHLCPGQAAIYPEVPCHKIASSGQEVSKIYQYSVNR